ncbi:MAG: PolC-type DNA polymerase III [Limnochordia bacterium]|jgi:DNA polymerase-3 subunit alpha (Gram-positive type)
MSVICVIEPAPDHWQRVLQEAGIVENWLEELTVRRVEVHVQEQGWRVFLGNSLDSERQRELKARLRSLFPQVKRVDLVCPSLEEEDDDAYLERILKEAQQRPTPTPQQESSAIQYGRIIKAPPRPIETIQEEEKSVVVAGEIIALESQPMRSGRTLLRFDLTDLTDSITVKVFLKEGSELPLRVGMCVLVRGPVATDRYTQELTLMANDICQHQLPIRQDDAPEKRIELHFHSKMSAMDSTTDLKKAFALAADWGHPALAITDHGVVQAFPEAHQLAQKHGVRVIYGMEGYLVDEPTGPSYHIVILAQNQVGLKNLYRLVSLSHLDYFYRTPRILREELIRHREGLLLGSACEAGELYQALLAGEPAEKLAQIASFYDYLEIQPLANNAFLLREGKVSSEEDLMALNEQILSLGRQLSLPVVATGDVHFLNPEDNVYREILLAGQGYEDAAHQPPLYLHTTTEMLEEFAYLGKETAWEVVIENPRKIAAAIEEIAPIPDGLHPPKMPGAEEEITEMARRRLQQLYGSQPPELVTARLERELKAICDNGYAPLYLIAHRLVQKSLSDGYLVGSRGSVGSSLVATLCGITEVNPLPPHYLCPQCQYCDFLTSGEVEAGVDLDDAQCPACGDPLHKLGFDIPFEVFMGFHGDKVPDIDLNFSGEYQGTIHQYTEELFGAGHVYRAGTIATLADRTAFGFVKKFTEEQDLVLRDAELNRLIQGCTGVKRTTGQHPGGLMVVPEGMDIHDFSPIQYPANDRKNNIITTHFDYHAISECLVKLDILGHDDPTMLRMLGDLTGTDPQDIPLDDPATMSLFSGTEALGLTPEEAGCPVGTLGIPEFGTRFVRQMLDETRPKTFGELVRISGFSHGTNVWTNNAQELIRSGQATLMEAIACRDDIMLYLIRQGVEAGRAFKIMEQVRKGRGLSEEDISIMEAHQVPRWYIESCQKISYMFPKAHAVAYVTMAFRIAYYKVHHPQAFYATYFTTRAGDFDAHLILQGHQTLKERFQEIERKGNGATAKEKAVAGLLEVVLESLARGISFLPVDLYESNPKTFLITSTGLLPPLIGLQGLGEAAAESIMDARREGPFTSVEDLRRRTRLTKTVIEILEEHGALATLPAQDQLTLF